MTDQQARKAGRKHVFMNAVIISEGGSHSARIADLLSTSVRISCNNPPLANREVIFKRGSVFAAARVAWADQTSARLEFYTEVDAEAPTALRAIDPIPGVG